MVAERLSKIRIRYWLRCGEIHCAVDICVVDYEFESANHVFERDPTHPLLTVADLSANTHLKRGQHSLKCASFIVENDSEACVNDSDSFGFCRASRFFPCNANLSQEITAWSTFFC